MSAAPVKPRSSAGNDFTRQPPYVDDGIAVLEGTVDSEREKKEAQRLAHVEGVLGVNNRLHVRGTGK
jgi:hypothetical protein